MIILEMVVLYFVLSVFKAAYADYLRDKYEAKYKKEYEAKRQASILK